MSEDKEPKICEFPECKNELTSNHWKAKYCDSHKFENMKNKTISTKGSPQQNKKDEPRVKLLCTIEQFITLWQRLNKPSMEITLTERK